MIFHRRRSSLPYAVPSRSNASPPVVSVSRAPRMRRSHYRKGDECGIGGSVQESPCRGVNRLAASARRRQGRSSRHSQEEISSIQHSAAQRHDNLPLPPTRIHELNSKSNQRRARVPRNGMFLGTLASTPCLASANLRLKAPRSHHRCSARRRAGRASRSAQATGASWFRLDSIGARMALSRSQPGDHAIAGWSGG